MDSRSAANSPRLAPLEVIHNGEVVLSVTRPSSCQKSKTGSKLLQANREPLELSIYNHQLLKDYFLEISLLVHYTPSNTSVVCTHVIKLDKLERITFGNESNLQPTTRPLLVGLPLISDIKRVIKNAINTHVTVKNYGLKISLHPSSPNDSSLIEFNYPELFEMKNEKEFSKSKTPGSPFIKDGQPHLGQSNEIVRDSERMLVELLRTKELWSVGGDSVTSSPRSGLLGLFMTGLYDNNHVLIKKFDRNLDLIGFYNEVYVSRKLSPCPYFLKFLRANDQDAPFIVYEYFEGKDLIEEMPSIRPGHEYCLAYYIADAMKNLASVGLTMLNLSPKNIVVRKHENGCYQVKLIPIDGAFVPIDLSSNLDGSVSPTSPTSKPPSQTDLTSYGQLILAILRREWPLRAFDVASTAQSPRYNHLVAIAQYCLSARSATDRTSFEDILKRLAGFPNGAPCSMQAVPLSPKPMPAAFDRKEFRMACVNIGVLMADMELELQFNLIKNQSMHDTKVQMLKHAVESEFPKLAVFQTEFAILMEKLRPQNSLAHAVMLTKEYTDLIDRDAGNLLLLVFSMHYYLKQLIEGCSLFVNENLKRIEELFLTIKHLYNERQCIELGGLLLKLRESIIWQGKDDQYRVFAQIRAICEAPFKMDPANVIMVPNANVNVNAMQIVINN